jgi:uncharacterized protein YqgV (UPF0045/DUF77 family)
VTERVTLEFTIEPFTPSLPGPHVVASIDAARATSAEVEVGPFGTTVVAAADEIAETTRAVITAALANGATRISMQISTDQPETRERT